jgi:hypothetical protein
MIEINIGSLILEGAPPMSPSKYLAHIVAAQGMPLVNLERLDRTMKSGMDTGKLLKASPRRALKKEKLSHSILGNGYTHLLLDLADRYLDVVVAVLNMLDLDLNDFAPFVKTVMSPEVDSRKRHQDPAG